MSKLSMRVQSPAQLLVEIDAIKQLIEKREKWLADPVNKMRTTYMSIKNDQDTLTKKLASLELEYEYIIYNPTQQ